MSKLVQYISYLLLFVCGYVLFHGYNNILHTTNAINVLLLKVVRQQTPCWKERGAMPCWANERRPSLISVPFWRSTRNTSRPSVEEASPISCWINNRYFQLKHFVNTASCTGQTLLLLFFSFPGNFTVIGNGLKSRIPVIPMFSCVNCQYRCYHDQCGPEKSEWINHVGRDTLTIQRVWVKGIYRISDCGILFSSDRWFLVALHQIVWCRSWPFSFPQECTHDILAALQINTDIVTKDILSLKDKAQQLVCDWLHQFCRTTLSDILVTNAVPCHEEPLREAFIVSRALMRTDCREPRWHLLYVDLLLAKGEMGI